MAATFNPELMRRASEIAAMETRAAAIPWSFSPVLDLGRNPYRNARMDAPLPARNETGGPNCRSNHRNLLVRELDRRKIKDFLGGLARAPIMGDVGDEFIGSKLRCRAETK